MPNRPHSSADFRAALDYVRRGGSVREGWRLLRAEEPGSTLSEGGFSSRFNKAQHWARAQGEAPVAATATGRYRPLDIPQPPPEPPRGMMVSADEAWAQLDAWIGRSQHRHRVPPATATAGVERIVIVTDIHAPFHHQEFLAEMIAREREQTDTLIIGGDLLDLYSISRFIKYEPVSIEQEMAGGMAVLETLAANFPRVILMEGNHDVRLDKQLRDRISEDMLRLLEIICGGEINILKFLSKRFENVSLVANQIDGHRVGWFYQHGDLIVSHAEKFSKVPGSALRAVEEWFRDRDDVLGLAPWRVLAQAHTHQMLLAPYNAQQLLVETGCCCSTHGYMLSAKIAGRPQRRGYVTLTQRDGATDLNSVRLVWLDADRRTDAA